MEDYKQMMRRHEIEIQTLQDNCKHDNVSDWIEYFWAPGHFGGYVKMCRFCGKTVLKSDTLTGGN